VALTEPTSRFFNLAKFCWLFSISNSNLAAYISAFVRLFLFIGAFSTYSGFSSVVAAFTFLPLVDLTGV